MFWQAAPEDQAHHLPLLEVVIFKELLPARTTTSLDLILAALARQSKRISPPLPASMFLMLSDL